MLLNRWENRFSFFCSELRKSYLEITWECIDCARLVPEEARQPGQWVLATGDDANLGFLW